jgi:hypothetical protein
MQCWLRPPLTRRDRFDDALVAKKSTALLLSGAAHARAYRKSNPDIFVMQSAEDRAAKNTPCPIYGAR